MIRASDEGRVAPHGVGKYLTQIAMVFAVQFAAGKLAEVLPIINSGGIGPVWPASGIALAAFLLFGYRVWPGVAAAAFLLTLLSPIPPVAAVVYALGSTLAALTGAFLLRRVVNFDPSLSRLRDVLGLIVLGAFGSSVVSASIGVSVLYAVHLRGWSGFGRAWLIYWLGDSMGVLLVTPLVLTVPNLLRTRPRVRIAEFAVLLLLLTVACFIVFGDLPLIPVRLHVLAFAVLPFVMWAAIRFGVSGATLSTLFVATIATTETALGSGPFAQNTPLTNAILLDVFFALLSLSGMTLAAVIAERERAEREREELVREQASWEARLRLATIVESSDDAIIGQDMDGMITDWNKGAERLYGYSADEVIGRPISLLVAPDRSSDFAEVMATLRRGNSLKHYETVSQKKDGTRTEVSLTMSITRDTKGRVLGTSAIGRDISERKRQEAILRESEERLRVAAEVGRMYAWEWDPATDSVLRSAECARILGLSDAQQGIAKDYLSFIHPDDRAELWSLVHSLTPEDPVYRTQYRRFRPDRSQLWLEESGCATFDGDGKMVRLIGMTADITERKLAQEELRNSEERLSLAIQAGRMYAFEWDSSTDVIVRTGECADIFNWMDNPERVTGQQFVDRIHPDDREAYAVLRADLIPENPIYKTSYRVLRPDGSLIWLEANGRAFFDGQGRMLRIIGMVTDVTERKLAEEALSSVSRRLIEAQEQERARIARELHDDLSQRMALLQIGLEQFEQDTGSLSFQARQQLHKIAEVTTEISSVIHNLSHRLHPSKLDTLGLVVSLGGLCREFSEQHRLHVQFVHHDVPGQIPQDVTLCLFRIAQEALQNVVKHSGTAEAEVELSGHGDRIDLCISDGGVGFDPESAKGAGGLGLVSMRERLRLVGGNFVIESESSHGTRIRVRVPLTATGAQDASEGRAHKAGA
jgi:PAS domain S-box-containing protein